MIILSSMHIKDNWSYKKELDTLSFHSYGKESVDVPAIIINDTFFTGRIQGIPYIELRFEVRD